MAATLGDAGSDDGAEPCRQGRPRDGLQAAPDAGEGRRGQEQLSDDEERLAFADKFQRPADGEESAVARHDVPVGDCLRTV